MSGDRLPCLLLLVSLVLCEADHNATQSSPSYVTARTTNGQVRGQLLDVDGVSVAQYLGIRYAEAPVGRLRYRKPVPAQPWHPETLDALEFASPCAQANGSLPPVSWLVSRNKVSEDCLFLNVWHPMRGPDSRGVLVWIHGGGYRAGTASDPDFDGKKLAAVGDVVVVTVNYRLGSFGYLYTGPGTSSGNYALWDHNLALRWVRDNIARFRGDPSRVTVWGESAGSIAIGSLLLSQQNAGLIHRAILASGSNFWLLPQMNHVGHEFTDRIAKHAGCLDPSKPSSKSHPAQVLQCLRSAPVDVIIDAEQTQFPDELVTFRPSFGDQFLPLPDLTALSKGLFIPLESLLVGGVTEEGSLFLYFKDHVLFGPKMPKLTKKQAFDFAVRHYFGVLPMPAQLMIKEFYQSNVTSDQDWEGVLRSLIDMVGDYLIFCPTKFHAELFANTNRPAYFYMLDHRSEKGRFPPYMGSMHFEDVQYFFGLPFVFPNRHTDEDRAFSLLCMRVVGAYVNNGKPELPEGDIDWPVFTRQQPTHVMLRAGNGSSVEWGFHEDGCNLYRRLYKMLNVDVP
uniref:Carboxylic ester hydrolase n=1 Tax=Amblyomma triste TaxID=251400 RepID=A0A023GNE1_AMBTT